MENFNGTMLEERLFLVAVPLLREARDEGGLVAAMAGIIAEVEEAWPEGGTPVACRPGCPHCCVLNVTLLLPEAAVIAVRLTETLPAAQLAGLSAQIDHRRMMVRWMEDGERVRKRVGCPFLDAAGSCSIHPFRPLMCRGVTSLDGKLCRAAFDPSEMDGPYAVPMDLTRKAAMDAAFCALARSLAACGWDSRGIELSAGVAAFLAHPELCSLLLTQVPLPSRLWE